MMTGSGQTVPRHITTYIGVVLVRRVHWGKLAFIFSREKQLEHSQPPHSHPFRPPQLAPDRKNTRHCVHSRQQGLKQSEEKN